MTCLAKSAKLEPKPLSLRKSKHTSPIEDCDLLNLSKYQWRKDTALFTTMSLLRLGWTLRLIRCPPSSVLQTTHSCTLFGQIKLGWLPGRITLLTTSTRLDGFIDIISVSCHAFGT